MCIYIATCIASYVCTYICTLATGYCNWETEVYLMTSTQSLLASLLYLLLVYIANESKNGQLYMHGHNYNLNAGADNNKKLTTHYNNRIVIIYYLFHLRILEKKDSS